MKFSELTQITRVFLAQAGYDELANAAREAWFHSAPVGPVTGEDSVEEATLETSNGDIKGAGVGTEAQSGETTGDNDLGNW
jgi:hypothetical protein